MLSIVPVIAMAFGLAKGFGFEKLLEKELYQKFAGQEEVISRVITFSQTMLENTQGGMIAGVGVVLLFWSVIKVLSNIEESFNECWDVTTNRSFARKFSDYLAIMLICPFLIISSSSMTVYVVTQVAHFAEQYTFLGPFQRIVFRVIGLAPYFMIWLLFTFLYIFMPNTKVQLSSAAIGGLVSGIAFQLLQWGYIYFQVGVARHNAIYGSFAALPMFMMWLELSWLVVLFGAELSFAHQNIDAYEFGIDSSAVSDSRKRLLSLLIASQIVKNFKHGKDPLTVRAVSNTLDLPVRLAEELVSNLEQAKVVIATCPEGTAGSGYVPATDIGKLTISYVLRAIDDRGPDSLEIRPSKDLEKLAWYMEKLRVENEQSKANTKLENIEDPER